MSISLSALRSFSAIARLGNLSSAARELHLTQPALSRHVKLIETQLGLPVFERAPGGSQLTEAGRAFRSFVDSALTNLKDGLEAVHAMRGGDSGTLRLCMAGTLCNDISLGVLHEFKNSHEGVEVLLDTQVNSEVGEAVLRGDANLGLQYQEKKHPRLHTEVVGQENVVVVCAPQHPLAKAKSVHPRELAGETWIGTPIALTDLASEYHRYLARFGLAGDKVMIAQSYAVRNRLIEANLGIGIAVRSVVRAELASGTLRILNVSAMRNVSSIVLVRRKSAYVTAAAQAFEEMLKQAFSRAERRR